MKASHGIPRAALTALVCLSTVGCNGYDNPKIVDAPPPPPPTAAETAAPKGKPKGYGTNDAYQKAMEKAATR